MGRIWTLLECSGTDADCLNVHKHLQATGLFTRCWWNPALQGSTYTCWAGRPARETAGKNNYEGVKVSCVLHYPRAL